MAENINISFAPNKNADEAQRIADIENYLQTLTERTKFAFSTIIEDYGESVTSNNSHAISGLSRLTNAVIYNDPVIISQDDANYLEYKYEIVDYYAGDIVTFGQSGNPIIVQGNPVYKDAPRELCSGLTSSVAFNEYSESFNLEKISYDKDGNETGRTYKHTRSYLKNGKWDTYVFTRSCAAGIEYLLRVTYDEICSPSDDYPYGCALIHTYGYNPTQTLNMSTSKTYCAFSSAAEYNAALNLTKSTLKKQSVSQAAIKSENYDSSANLPQIGVPDTIYTTTEPAAVWRYDSKNQKYVCVGRDYNQINEIKSDIYGTDEAGAMKLPVRQLTKSTEEWKADSTIYPRGMMLIAQDIETELGRRKSVIRIANGIDTWSDLSDTNYLPIATSDTIGGVMIGDNISVADDGTISVDLSTYLQSADIADWAKQPEKPVYTADEVGAAAEQHTHSTADITDFPAIPTKVSDLQNDIGYLSEETDPTVPAWAKADTKPTYTAAEVGAAEAVHTHSDIAAVSLSGQTIDIDTLTASETANKGKLMRYYCPVGSAQNITHRPTAVNEPFTLEVRNIRWASESSYISVQRYISTSGKREYLRWCTNGTWTAWQATEIRTIYGTITQAEAKSYSYASYGVGYVRVKLTALYNTDSGANLVNIKAAALVSTSDFERTMLTVNGVSLVWKISAGGDVTIEVVGGTGSFTYELQYFIN